MDISQLRDVTYKRWLELRSIKNLVQLESFEKAWSQATSQEQLEFIQLVSCGRRDACRNWHDAHIKNDLDALPIRQLRILARQKGIAKYHHLDKATLLMELSKHAS